MEAREAGDEEVVAWGDGSFTREFFYVEDAARSVADAAERYDDPELVNLGTAKEISNRELVGTVAELTGFEGRITWETSKPNG